MISTTPPEDYLEHRKLCEQFFEPKYRNPEPISVVPRDSYLVKIYRCEIPNNYKNYLYVEISEVYRKILRARKTEPLWFDCWTQYHIYFSEGRNHLGIVDLHNSQRDDFWIEDTQWLSHFFLCPEDEGLLLFQHYDGRRLRWSLAHYDASTSVTDPSDKFFIWESCEAPGFLQGWDEKGIEFTKVDYDKKDDPYYTKLDRFYDLETRGTEIRRTPALPVTRHLITLTQAPEHLFPSVFSAR